MYFTHMKMLPYLAKGCSISAINLSCERDLYSATSAVSVILGLIAN